MRTLLVDTGPLVALVNQRDRHHGWVKRAFAIEATMITCEAVLSETCFMLQRHRGGADAILTLWEEGGLVVASLVGQAASIRRLVARYTSVPMSYADGCLVRLMELHPEATLATCDSDFRSYRRFSRQTIPLLAPFDA